MTASHLSPRTGREEKKQNVSQVQVKGGERDEKWFPARWEFV